MSDSPPPPLPSLFLSLLINVSVMEKLGTDAIVMHPLPRLDEISPEVDDDPRAAYFRQVSATE